MADETGLRVGGWVRGGKPDPPSPGPIAPSEEPTAEFAPAEEPEEPTAGPEPATEPEPAAEPIVEPAAGPIDGPSENQEPGLVDLDLLPPAPGRVLAGRLPGRRYRGRRRQLAGAGVRVAGTVAVVATVGVVLIGSGVLANYFTEPVGLPVVPPSASASPSRSAPAPQGDGAPAPAPPNGVARPAVDPTPTPNPTSSPSPSPESDPEPAPDPPGPVSLTFEAEAAVRSDNLDVVPLRSASGEQVVRLFGWCTCHTVRFPEVTVPRAGEYELTIQHGRLRYEGRFSRTALLVVNDGDPFPVSMRAPRSGEVRAVTVTVRLREGQNTIQIGATSGDPAPNLDLIVVADPD